MESHQETMGIEKNFILDFVKSSEHFAGSMLVFIIGLEMLSGDKGYCDCPNREIAGRLRMDVSDVENKMHYAKKKDFIQIERANDEFGYYQRRIFLKISVGIDEDEQLSFLKFVAETFKTKECSFKIKGNFLKDNGQPSDQWAGENLSTTRFFTGSNGHFSSRVRCTEQNSYTVSNKNKENTVIQNSTPGVYASINSSSASLEPICTVVNDCAVAVMSLFPFDGSVTEVLSRLSKLDTREFQSKKLIKKYGFKLIGSVINYVEDLKQKGHSIANVGAYVCGCLIKIRDGNFSLSQAKTCDNNNLAKAKNLMGEGKSEAEIHWREGNKLVNKLLKDKNMTLDLLLNSVSLSRKPTILEFLEIFNSYQYPCPEKTIDALLDGESITLPKLKKELLKNLEIIEGVEKHYNTKDTEMLSSDNNDKNIQNEKPKESGEVSGGNSIKLTDREQKIVDHLKFNGSGAIRDFEPLIGLSKASVKILLNQMQASKIIVACGAGRSLHYKLAR